MRRAILKRWQFVCNVKPDSAATARMVVAVRAKESLANGFATCLGSLFINKSMRNKLVILITVLALKFILMMIEFQGEPIEGANIVKEDIHTDIESNSAGHSQEYFFRISHRNSDHQIIVIR